MKDKGTATKLYLCYIECRKEATRNKSQNYTYFLIILLILKLNLRLSPMKRLLPLLFLLCVCCIATIAKPRNNNEALQLAKLFAMRTPSLMASANSIKPTCAANVKGYFKSPSIENAAFYVYEMEKGKGFIIISGDDCAKTVLGYSDTGTFDMNKIPANLKYWLDMYRKEIAYAQANNLKKTANRADFAVRLGSSLPQSVAPLLGSISWNQSAPYNDLCPKDTLELPSVTGCVATAAAQIMRYWEWPLEGKGNHSYYCYGTKSTISAQFEGTKYDWDNMTETYGTSSTEKEKTAVATLMFHCGVACDMDYSSMGSSAETETMCRGMIQYFGYDKNLQIYKKMFYTSDEWELLLKQELAANRPVLYGGNSISVGHQFICDGYDTNGLFHINWGWSGISDGYFELTALDPDELGTGGGSVNSFSMWQDMVIGVAPQGKIESAVNYQIKVMGDTKSSVSTTELGKEFSIRMGQPSNRGINLFKGVVGFGLYDIKGNSIKELCHSDSLSWKTFQEEKYIDLNTTLPTTLTDGIYYIYPIYKASEQSDYSIMWGIVGTPYYLKVVVSGTTATISTPEDASPQLSREKCSVEGDSIYYNKKAFYNLTINNAGKEFCSYIATVLISKSNNKQYIGAYNTIDIPEGKSKSFTLSGKCTAPAGEYYLYVMYDKENRYITKKDFNSFGQLGDPLSVIVVETTEPDLLLTKAISFPNDNTVYKNDVKTDSVCIKNTGGAFNSSLIMAIFEISSQKMIATLGRQDKQIGKNEEVKVVFTGKLSELANESYAAVVCSLDDENQLVPIYGLGDVPFYTIFTLTDTPTDIKNLTANDGLAIFPSPANEEINISSEKVINKIHICDVTGKEVLVATPVGTDLQTINVTQLPTGIYIVNCYTPEGVITSKFAKK